MSDAKAKKPSFFKRIANRGREFLSLGRILCTQPKAFPRALLQFLKRSLRTIWDARGGGLYACGFLVTFVFLEIRMFFADIVEADSVGSFFSEQASELVFKYIGESFKNTISAFMWPVHVIELHPTWGVLFLAGMFVLFPRTLKKPLERWLFDEESAPN